MTNTLSLLANIATVVLAVFGGLILVGLIVGTLFEKWRKW